MPERFRFRQRDPGRFFSIPFLAVWLCGWAVGEVVVLVVLVHGLASAFTGAPMFGGGVAAPGVPVVIAAAFLLFWLAFWTVGGLAALQELLRLVGAEDRLTLEPDALLCQRRGPSRSELRLQRRDLRAVFLQPVRGALMAQQGERLVELTRLGSVAERQEACRSLRAALQLPEAGSSEVPAALPEAWELVRGPEGESLLVPDRRTRRQQAAVLSGISALALAVLLPLAWRLPGRPDLLPLTLMIGVLALWLSRQTLWHWQGRHEWRLERGWLVQQRRYREQVAVLCQAAALELEESRDGDGDRVFRLEASALSIPPFARRRRLPRRMILSQALHDPTEPLALGRWLSARTGIELMGGGPALRGSA